jgi:hypothetical protein
MRLLWSDRIFANKQTTLILPTPQRGSTLQLPNSMVAPRTVRCRELISRNGRVVFEIATKRNSLVALQHHQSRFLINDVQYRPIAKRNHFSERSPELGLHVGGIDAAELSAQSSFVAITTALPTAPPASFKSLGKRRLCKENHQCNGNEQGRRADFHFESLYFVSVYVPNSIINGSPMASSQPASRHFEAKTCFSCLQTDDQTTHAAFLVDNAEGVILG